MASAVSHLGHMDGRRVAVVEPHAVEHARHLLAVAAHVLPEERTVVRTVTVPGGADGTPGQQGSVTNNNYQDNTKSFSK